MSGQDPDDNEAISDLAATAMAGGYLGAKAFIESALGPNVDPALPRMLTLFTVGSFIKAGGLKISADDAAVIVRMLNEVLAEQGMTGPLN